MRSEDKVVGAFSEEHASELTGASRKQLREWDRIGLLRPSLGSGSTGLPYGRIYSFRDLVSLRVLGQLRNKYKIPIPHLQDVLKELGQLSDDPWSYTTLYVLNKRVVISSPNARRKHEVGSGQQILDVPLRVVITGVRDAVARLNERGNDKVGKVVHGKFVAQNQPVISGTRIPVSLIRSFISAGYNTQAILREFPDLTAADIEAANMYEGDSAAA